MHAFNSPVWFNVGVLEKPQCSACFIQSVRDRWTASWTWPRRRSCCSRAARARARTSPSALSTRSLSNGGGRPSGPVSFMKYFDKFAGATKSGGNSSCGQDGGAQRRPPGHPRAEADGSPGFITCKSHAEKVAHDLYSTGKYTAEFNVPGNVYDLVDYQNANNSVRVTDEFMKAVEKDGDWKTKTVGDGKPHKTEYNAATSGGDRQGGLDLRRPGHAVRHVTNEWHTCKNSGRINASNPCSEYLFLDDTACNLSSLNLRKFAKDNDFDIEAFEHGCESPSVARRSSSRRAPTRREKIERNSHTYRTLGLGYTNLGDLLTVWGLPYDSNDGRSVAACHHRRHGWRRSGMSASSLEVRARSPLTRTRSRCSNVIRKHWDAAKRIPIDHGQGLAAARRAGAGGLEGGARARQAVRLPQCSGHGHRSDGNHLFPHGRRHHRHRAHAWLRRLQEARGWGLAVMPNESVEPALRNLGY
jgi:ribonucleoside-diphosphate reductase alpha chain